MEYNFDEAVYVNELQGEIYLICKDSMRLK